MLPAQVHPFDRVSMHSCPPDYAPRATTRLGLAGLFVPQRLMGYGLAGLSAPLHTPVSAGAGTGELLVILNCLVNYTVKYK